MTTLSPETVLLSPHEDKNLVTILSRSEHLYVTDFCEFFILQHMDVIFYYLRKKGKYGNVRKPFTTTNSYFLPMLTRCHDAWSKAKNKDVFDWTDHLVVLDYITAEKQTGFANTPWADVNTIYVPVHVPDHWLLVVISLSRRALTIYDSMDSKYARNVRDSIQMMADFIPIVLAVVGLGDGNSEPFKIVIAPMPQQSNG